MGILKIFKKDSDLPEPKKPKVDVEEVLSKEEEKVDVVPQQGGIEEEQDEIDELKKAFSMIEEKEKKEEDLEEELKEAENNLESPQSVDEITLTPEEMELEEISSYYQTIFKENFEYPKNLQFGEGGVSFRQEIIERTTNEIRKNKIEEKDEEALLNKLIRKYYKRFSKEKDAEIKYYKAEEIKEVLAVIMKKEEELNKKEKVLERKEREIDKKIERDERKLEEIKNKLRKIREEEKKLRKILKEAARLKKKEKLLEKKELELNKREEKLVMMLKSINILKSIIEKEEKELEEEKKMIEQNMFKKLLEEELKKIFDEEEIMEKRGGNIFDLAEKYPSYSIFQKIIEAIDSIKEGNVKKAMENYKEAVKLYEKDLYPIKHKKEIKAMMRKLYVDINLALLEK